MQMLSPINVFGIERLTMSIVKLVYFSTLFLKTLIRKSY